MWARRQVNCYSKGGEKIGRYKRGETPLVVRREIRSVLSEGKDPRMEKVSSVKRGGRSGSPATEELVREGGNRKESLSCSRETFAAVRIVPHKVVRGKTDMEAFMGERHGACYPK